MCVLTTGISGEEALVESVAETTIDGTGAGVAIVTAASVSASASLEKNCINTIAVILSLVFQCPIHADSFSHRMHGYSRCVK